MLVNKDYSYFLPIKGGPLNLNQANNIPVVHGSSVKGFMSYDQRYNQTNKDYYSIYIIINIILVSKNITLLDLRLLRLISVPSLMFSTLSS